MKTLRNLGLIGLATLLAACGGGGFLNRDRPDEFAVTRSQPLVVPPDFALTPPKPGSPRPLAADSQQQAMEALFGQGVRVPPKSQSEQSMLDNARANRSDPMIRNNAGDPATTGVDKGAFLRELLDAPAATRNEQVAKVTVGG